jgi:hypothetical protein
MRQYSALYLQISWPLRMEKNVSIPLLVARHLQGKKNNDDLEQKEWVRVAVQLLCTNHRIKVSMQKHQDE